MKYVRIISRILLGLVFIFSGFVKGIDPMGWTIKFTEYCEAFHLGWLSSFALVLSIILSTSEFLIGVCLVTGLRMKLTSWAALIFMSFFTVLTFYIAIANPVTDCGCFGDALVITNWQTFYKNIVLIALAIFIFYSRRKYKPYSKPFAEWVLVVLFASIGVGISVYCYQHLPIMDFRPYNIGSHIPTKMATPPGAPSDKYLVTFIYVKNGVEKEFTDQNLPDSTWTYKDRKSVELIEKGYTPPIHNFSISEINGNDITDMVLKDTSYSFIFIAQNAEKIAPEQFEKIQNYYHFCLKTGHKFYVLTSTPQHTIEQIKAEKHLPFDFHFTDETVLKTIIRSNPGLVLLKDGIILGNWHFNDFPKPEYFEGNIMSTVIASYSKSIEWKRIIILGIGLIIIFVAMSGFRKR